MSKSPKHLVSLISVIGAATALSYLFWSDLWHGGGPIGGDLYTYFFPQKQFFAEQLSRVEFPLWNPLVGHGYPLVAESQTGPFYVFNLIFYRIFDVNTAYNIVQLLHYILAFVFTWMFARRLELSYWGAGLAALVYTYGWFPSRFSLEWAIIGGAWLPLALWCVELFFSTRHWRYLALLCIALTLQLLAGHFNLAFITQLTLLAYVPLRLWLAPQGLAIQSLSPRIRYSWLVMGAIFFSFALAAIQLIATAELKLISQRESVGESFHPGYGNLPVAYWPQMVLPWIYYSGDVDNRVNTMVAAGMPPTNKVEAHLYFGLVPIYLIFYGAVTLQFFRDRRLLLWLGLGLAALLYTPGWFLPITQHLPGFGFFSGPARYGIITTLAAGILAGAVADRLIFSRAYPSRNVLACLLFIVTTIDLWIVGGTITDAVIVAEPAIGRIAQSPIRKILSEHEGPVRLFCRGANLPTLLGVASTPAYLGIGPREYYDPKLKMPEPLPFDSSPTSIQIEWLQKAGVTHILSFSDLDRNEWPVTPLFAGFDSLLNPAWARRENLFLYELNSSRGRIAWQNPQPGDSAQIIEYHPNTVTANVSSTRGGRLILTDLPYPGWSVTINGDSADSLIIDGMYRGVDVPPGEQTVEWNFRPLSLYVGTIISIATVLVLSVIGFLRFRHQNRRFDRSNVAK